MSDGRGLPSGLASVVTIALLTWKRLSRGKALWVGAIIASVPVLFASAMRTTGSGGAPSDLMAFELLMLAVLPAMFVSSSIGEEIEERTTVYLWSRPVPRWSVLAGKLGALVPVVIGLAIGSWLAALFVGPKLAPTLDALFAIAAGGTAISLVAAGIATLVPKHGMPLTISYMLFFDLPIGLMPVSLSELSITHQIRVISGIGLESWDHQSLGGALPLAILSALWLAVAVLRIRKLEA
ncbi:MAG: ABC transporter permease [Deltaproteobacteria bacterium]|nr:ABC transporter permease [Deltaproteobacteria bacterium]